MARAFLGDEQGRGHDVGTARGQGRDQAGERHVRQLVGHAQVPGDGRRHIPMMPSRRLDCGFLKPCGGAEAVVTTLNVLSARTSSSVRMARGGLRQQRGRRQPSRMDLSVDFLECMNAASAPDQAGRPCGYRCTAAAASAQNSCMTVAARKAVALCTWRRHGVDIEGHEVQPRGAAANPRQTAPRAAPGAQDGSKISMSKHRYTGRWPMRCLIASSAPVRSASKSSKGTIV